MKRTRRRLRTAHLKTADAGWMQNDITWNERQLSNSTVAKSPAFAEYRWWAVRWVKALRAELARRG